ncbi:AraC-like ligand binding domain-containing protein [Paenibacillus sp. UNC496MF]|uniref:AraC family transcriptional regulator n=1 Tax=Paenibacillus sp. UNC496MF TaxID=1502753 RepID=UPI0008E8879B|nr:AraC family transcriptional regulator [Paenibacillus sp. UNC496MF]SFI36860.1 AraC-like ligand binding domain-containing protein [Paenibacillus sp. UNC496MF]
MAYMNIPYGLDDPFDLPDFRFKMIWKVHADDGYQAAQPKGFPYPGIFVTFEGGGRFESGGVSRGLEAGTYMIVRPGEPCAYRCEGGDWKFYFLHFDPLDMALQLELAVGEPATTAKLPEASLLCERLIDCLIVHPVGYGFTAQHAAQELLLVLAREQAANAESRHPELDGILFRMHQRIGEPPPIDDFVRRSGLSRTAFFARFRARTGMSPARYMQELRLASAKAALETTNAAVKEIAAALGFYDEFHFSKLFKQRYGAAPRDYRRGR